MLAAGWLTAAATAGLLLFAIIAAVFGYLTFRSQGDQLALLKQQRDDELPLRRQEITVLSLWAQEMRGARSERQIQAAQDRRAQAEHVIVWQQHLPRNPRVPQTQTSGPVVVAHVHNTSGSPITELKYRWVLGGMLYSQADRVEPLLAGDDDQDASEIPPGSDPSMFNVVAYFRDANQVLWRRRARDGILDELPPGEEVPHC